MRLEAPRPLHLFADVRAVLDTALRNEGKAATLSFQTKAAATAWVHRANKFRVASRRNDELRHNLLHGEGSSPYDQLVFLKAGLTIRIEFRRQQGTLLIDGQETTPEADNIKDEFDLEAAFEQKRESDLKD